MLIKWGLRMKNFFTYHNNKCVGCLTYATLQYILMTVYHTSKCNEDKLTNPVPLEKPSFANSVYT